MIRACVMGYPVAHSLSPKLHGFWLKKYNIDGAYTRQEVKPEGLRAALERLAEQGFAGCNLTIPLKEHALALMDELDGSALAAGAVNTVVMRDGRKTGYNSDGFGFLESLKAQYPQWNGARVVILGAGGAARGIIAALNEAAVGRFVLVNRSREKAEKLAGDLKLDPVMIVDWEDRAAALENATLLVNCSSLGMDGQPPLDLDLSGLPKTAAVCDIVYRPLVTKLLAEAKRRGHPVVEGLPMLLHQGRLGFRHWFGVDPAVTKELYDEITTGIT
ncbi:MAG: shikimate dehydrogenase [Alphaproteobacteria bacterium]|nr:shikimate dehydrogenase [Alphaproteobacteria bacterium]